MMTKMGWRNGGGPEGGGDQTPETQSDRSASPTGNDDHAAAAATINTSGNSNAQLVTKISTMEAAHLNQLHEVTSQMAERELAYKEEVMSRDAQLRQSQNRVDAVEQRIRERDAQVTSLREEKADCVRQIADLKNQLYQLVSFVLCRGFDHARANVVVYSQCAHLIIVFSDVTMPI